MLKPFCDTPLCEEPAACSQATGYYPSQTGRSSEGSMLVIRLYRAFGDPETEAPTYLCAKCSIKAFREMADKLEEREADKCSES